jgi:ubiquinone/menaquinone biosynthesis C-methylase UbiE
MSEIEPSFELRPLPPEIHADRRQALLDAFSDHPEDEDLWDAAYEWVRGEGDSSEQTGIAADIPAEELIAMADLVRRTAQSERYDLMTNRASNGKYWFDVIEGFSSDSIREALADVVQSWATDGNTPTYFYNALDIGTGAGKSLNILKGHAENVIGLDQNPALLRIAQERAGERTGLVLASATNLPFEDSSFDLIVSQGLRAALDKQASEDFLHELSRVMTPDGVYIEGHYYFDEAGNPHREMGRYAESSKAMLSDMIGDSVSGALSRIDRLESNQELLLLTELGMDLQHYDVLDQDGESHNLISVIRKKSIE